MITLNKLLLLYTGSFFNPSAAAALQYQEQLALDPRFQSLFRPHHPHAAHPMYSPYSVPNFYGMLSPGAANLSLGIGAAAAAAAHERSTSLKLKDVHKVKKDEDSERLEFQREKERQLREYREQQQKEIEREQQQKEQRKQEQRERLLAKEKQRAVESRLSESQSVQQQQQQQHQLQQQQQAHISVAEMYNPIQRNLSMLSPMMPGLSPRSSMSHLQLPPPSHSISPSPYHHAHRQAPHSKHGLSVAEMQAYNLSSPVQQQQPHQSSTHNLKHSTVPTSIALEQPTETPLSMLRYPHVGQMQMGGHPLNLQYPSTAGTVASNLPPPQHSSHHSNSASSHHNMLSSSNGFKISSPTIPPQHHTPNNSSSAVGDTLSAAAHLNLSQFSTSNDSKATVGRHYPKTHMNTSTPTPPPIMSQSQHSPATSSAQMARNMTNSTGGVSEKQREKSDEQPQPELSGSGGGETKYPPQNGPPNYGRYNDSSQTTMAYHHEMKGKYLDDNSGAPDMEQRNSQAPINQQQHHHQQQQQQICDDGGDSIRKKQFLSSANKTMSPSPLTSGNSGTAATLVKETYAETSDIGTAAAGETCT